MKNRTINAIVGIVFTGLLLLTLSGLLNTSAARPTAVFPPTVMIQSQGYIVASNTWNLTTYTNGVPNFATIVNASSNGFPVDIYMSNGTAFVYYQLGHGSQIIP